MYYKPNKPKVILESFEDEIVIINLESGNYYSFEKLGAVIWELIEKGQSLSNILSYIINNYSKNQGDVKNDIQKFIAELEKEGLILPEEKEPSLNDHDEAIENMLISETAPDEYASPILNRYTDMQDLLLLDPIHEVDEKGWPARKTDPTTGEQGM